MEEHPRGGVSRGAVTKEVQSEVYGSRNGEGYIPSTSTWENNHRRYIKRGLTKESRNVVLTGGNRDRYVVVGGYRDWWREGSSCGEAPTLL